MVVRPRQIRRQLSQLRLRRLRPLLLLHVCVQGRSAFYLLQPRRWRKLRSNCWLPPQLTTPQHRQKRRLKYRPTRTRTAKRTRR